jgi:hypothetical protein
MYLIQILLPLSDREGKPYPDSVITSTRDGLTHKFGGVTAYLRAPAEGAWKPDSAPGAKVERDRIVIVEVMVKALDRDWWSSWRKDLERELGQEEILVRAINIEKV